MLATIFITLTALAACTLASTSGETATVVLQTGTGSSATNKTISISINTIYSDASSLSSGISTLYITDASGIPLDSVICTPFKKTDGTSPAGKAFTSTKPSELAGDDSNGLASIVCITTAIKHAPPGGPASTTASSSASGTRPGTATGASATPQSTGNAATSLYLPGELFGGLALAGFGLAFAL